MKRLNVMSIMLLLLLMNSGCAIYHHYDPYYGKLVDAETKQPLEGGVVLFYYMTYLHLSPGGPVSYFLDAQEVVSDKNGEFMIPSLNAFAFRPLSTFREKPYINIFKPRYGCYPGVWSTSSLVPNAALHTDKYMTVEMLKLSDIDKRIRNTGCYALSVPDEMQIKFIDARNTERVDLGLQPTHVRKSK